MARNRVIYQVDAFTNQPFQGNPAGVCLLSEPATESWMQSMAAEMNVSETAFTVSNENGFDIRYFTPMVEVPLCGHATLASAHILWEQRVVDEDQTIVFNAKAGVLTAQREGDWLCLDFPANPVTPTAMPEGICEALGTQALSAHRIENTGYLLELETEEAVRLLRPDFNLIRERKFGRIIATSRSRSQQVDFVSRFFAPEVGIDEDPVTGSAHCSLGPYWAERLGKTDMLARQISKRGGMLKVRVNGSRVDIVGQAITVFRGELSA